MAAASSPHAWMEHGLCRGATANFFPERGESTLPAKAICRQCPVAEECLRYALDNSIRHGIFGGYSERERRPMRIARNQPTNEGDAS